jgi:transcriptional antiterminator NusG
MEPHDSNSGTGDGHLNWFALKTVTHEKTVAECLRMKGFEEFLPLYKTRKRWSDRFKEVHLPFFPGYIFCRFDVTNRLPILTTQGVSFIVGSGKIPIAIPDQEIAALKLVVSSGLAAGPCPFLELGQRVRIGEGPLEGLEGILTNIKSEWRVVVSVSLLQRSLSVEIDRQWIRTISSQVKAPAMYQRTFDQPRTSAGTI